MQARQYRQLEQSVPSAWYSQDINRIRQKQKLNSHYLTMATLSEHVGRFYLDGKNTFSNPWRLPMRPPEYLFPLIFLPEYESFRDEVNKLLSYRAFWDWTLFVYLPTFISRLGLICLIFPPASLYLYDHMRKKRAMAFEQYIARGNHFFLRGPRAQALLESVKCGYDDKYSIAYIDLLYLESISPPEGLTVGKE